MFCFTSALTMIINRDMSLWDDGYLSHLTLGRKLISLTGMKCLTNLQQVQHVIHVCTFCWEEYLLGYSESGVPQPTVDFNRTGQCPFGEHRYGATCTNGNF